MDRRARAAFALASLPVVACTTITGAGDFLVADAVDVVADAGEDAPVADAPPVIDATTVDDSGIDVAVPPCPEGMVLGATPEYCIDVTEVTVAAYDAFLASSPSTSEQPSVCAWNTSFAPTTSGTAQMPVRGVDWCDARAYCAFVGKRLCGRLGGGSLDTAGAISAAASEWFAACTAGGTRVYPYGDTYDPQACVGADKEVGGVPPSQPAPVGTNPLCEGGVPGLFDMSGNVFEWQDACEDGSGANPAKDYCASTGGDYGEDAVDMACRADEVHERSESFDWIGFRCCKDAAR